MSKCKITGKVLSIQLGREETRIALIAGSEVLRSVSLMTPEGAVEDGEIRNLEAVRDLLKRALREPDFKRVRQAVFALCTTQVITSDPQTVPDLAEAKLEKLIAANMDTYFPIDIQDYNVVWQAIGPKTGDSGIKEQEVKLWAVPKAMLGNYYAVANAVGLSLVAVSYCGSSIVNALGASFAKPAQKAAKAKKGSFLTMEIGLGKKKEVEPEGSGAAVATDVRDVPGTELHISAESDMLGMTFIQNGQVVMQRFIPCGAYMTDVLGEAAMIVEYYRTLDTGRGSQIQGFLSGGLAWDNRLAADLEDMLGISLCVYQGEYDPQWLMCCGAALATMDFGMPALNSPGKARRQVQSQVWQYGLILAGGLALVSAILMLLSSRLIWNSSLGNLKNSQQSLQIQAAQVAGYADNYKNYASSYDSYSADWDTVFANLQTYNDNLVLVLEELEQTLPEKASVTNMQISQDGMSVQFACENKEVAAYLIMALRELKYADLAAISNLSGGGAGPATGYANKEAAPTEGSYDPAPIDSSTVVDLIASELTQEELMDLAFGMSDEEFELLEAVYGRHPVNTYTSLADLKRFNAEADSAKFFEQRSNALRTMLNTNPFAMNRFMNLLEEDLYRDEEAILWWFILEDLLKLEQEGAFGNGSVDDIDSIRQYINILVTVMTKDEATLSAAEQLICTDPVEELWYIYYLEVQMGIRESDKYIFLNMEKIMEDVMSGGFKTGNAGLDAKLNGLISDEAWAKIDQLTSAEGITELLDAYFLTGTTGDPELDALIHNYLTTGTTGYEQLDDAINDYISSGAADEHMAVMVESYLVDGTTGNAALDQLISNFLTTGTTGSVALDAAINRFLSSGKLDATLAQLLEKYAVDGTTGVPAVDGMINLYVENGTTGNPALDAMIEDYISTVAASITQEMISEMFRSYMETGTTGNKLYDLLINRYLSDGTTGNTTLDAMIAEFMNGSGGGETGGFTEAQIKAMLEKYMAEGTTGNPVMDAMIDSYLNTGTTGMEELDALIESYIDQMIGAITDQQIEDMITSYLEDGTTGNKLYDKLIRKYLLEGTTGIEKLDKLIEAYFKANGDEGETNNWKEMLDKFIKSGTTGNSWVDDLIMNYFKTGTTGNTELDAVINAYIDDMIEKTTDKDIADMVDKYMTEGTTGNKLFDLVIWIYLEDGTTHNKKLDELIMNAIAANLTKDKVAQLVNKYLTDGTTGNKLYDRLIQQYLNSGSTGNAVIDALIKEYLSSSIISGDISGDDLENLLGTLLGGSTGSTGGVSSGDTRIYFTVSLKYNDNLKNAELIRKGLTYTDKIAKLEVAE